MPVPTPPAWLIVLLHQSPGSRRAGVGAAPSTPGSRSATRPSQKLPGTHQIEQHRTAAASRALPVPNVRSSTPLDTWPSGRSPASPMPLSETCRNAGSGYQGDMAPGGPAYGAVERARATRARSVGHSAGRAWFARDMRLVLPSFGVAAGAQLSTSFDGRIAGGGDADPVPVPSAAMRAMPLTTPDCSRHLEAEEQIALRVRGRRRVGEDGGVERGRIYALYRGAAEHRWRERAGGGVAVGPHQQLAAGARRIQPALRGEQQVVGREPSYCGMGSRSRYSPARPARRWRRCGLHRGKRRWPSSSPG